MQKRSIVWCDQHIKLNFSLKARLDVIRAQTHHSFREITAMFLEIAIPLAVAEKRFCFGPCFLELGPHELEAHLRVSQNLHYLAEQLATERHISLPEEYRQLLTFMAEFFENFARFYPLPRREDIERRITEILDERWKTMQ